MGGRHIRGNSVAEAVSLGTLAIMDKNEVTHHELIIDECDVKTMDQMVSLINKLENNPDLYQELLAKQRKVLKELFFEAPVQSLVNCLEEKRKTGKAKPYKWYNKIADRFCFIK